MNNYSYGRQICRDFYWKQKLAPIRKFLLTFYQIFNLKK